MADKSLRYVVSAVDKNAGKTIGDVASKGSKAAGSIGQAFGKLGPIIGGEVGELAAKLSEHLDGLGEHGGKGLAAKLQVGGAAMVGVGASLSMMGAAEKQASDQLEVAVSNTGHSIEEFSGKIDASVGHMEKYGFTAIQTKDALTTLTNATHDPSQALKMMGEAADLAAVRHISLNGAADMLAKTVGGSTRLYKQFGIQVTTNADGTKNLTEAQGKLAAMLHGQADAAANNFTGRLKALRAEVTDGIASFGEKYGPAITAAGAAMTLITPIAKGVGSGLKSLAGIFKSTADAGIVADEAAAASTGELSDAVAGSTASQSGSFATVASGAQAASTTAVTADEEAEASTGNLAAAVQASSTVQVSAFAEVGAAAQGGADATVTADAEITAANEAAAASSVSAGEGAAAVRGGFLAAAAPVAGLAVGLGAVAVGGFALSNWLESGRADISKMAGSFDDLRTAVLAGEGSFEKLGTQVVQAQLKSDGFANRASAAGITMDQLTAGVTGNNAAFNKLTDTWIKSGKPSSDTIFKLRLLHVAYGTTRDETDKLTTSEKKQTEALNPLAAGLGTTNSALTTAQQAAKKTADSNRANTLQMQYENNAAGLLSAGLDKLNGRTLGVEEANIAFKNSEQQVTDAVKQNGHSLSDNTQKGRDNRSAILSSIQAAQQHAQAIATQTGSTDRATAAYRTDIGALKAHLIHLGYDKDAVQRLISKYGQVPHLVQTRIDANTELARRAAQDYITWLQNLPTVTVGVDFAANRASTRASQVPRGHASGTDFAPGGLALIAERETEVILPRGDSVTPMSKIHRGSGGAPVIINFNLPTSALYSPQAARDLVTSLENYLRSGGGIKGITY